MALSSFFLDSAGDRIHCTFFRPIQGANGTGVLVVPPWAEEMNKSRRMLTLLGSGLASKGTATLMPDFFGTGDSDGDFGTARLAIWLTNILDAVSWLRALGCQQLVMVGLRTGSALAGQAAGALDQPPRGLVYWQPVVKGRQYLTQFLRLRLAGSMQGGSNRENTSDLRARLAADETFEVAGYELSPALAADLERLDVTAFVPPAECPVHWIELGPRPGTEPLPVSQQAITELRAKGVDLRFSRIVGEAFWSTQEIVEVPELIERSVERIRGLLD